MTSAIFANNLTYYLPDLRQISRVCHVVLPIIATSALTMAKAGPVLATVCLTVNETYLEYLCENPSIEYPNIYTPCFIGYR